MDLPEEAKRAPSAPVWNQSFPSPRRICLKRLSELHLPRFGINTSFVIGINSWELVMEMYEWMRKSVSWARLQNKQLTSGATASLSAQDAACISVIFVLAVTIWKTYKLNWIVCRSISQYDVWLVLVRSFSETKDAECRNSVYGCCRDGVTAASGPDYHGCMPRDPVPQGIECALSHYGCCRDNHTAAEGPNGEGCPTVDCRVAVFQLLQIVSIKFPILFFVFYNFMMNKVLSKCTMCLKTRLLLHFQIMPTNMVQYQQFMVYRIDIKIFIC